MQRILAYLQLCRFAALFTAMADIFCGYLLAHWGLGDGWDFAWLLASSSCLYLAGMVFNDVFDREIDAQERPKRPIPSGRVSVRAAVTFGTILVIGGLVSAGIVGMQSAVVAGLLTACIFLYDGVLKATIAGPVAMGACRFLNVMLGASTAADIHTGMPAWGAVWALPQLHVAAALGTYIVGVTWFARKEAGRSSQVQLVAAAGVANLGIALLIAFVLNWPEADEVQRSFQAMLALLLAGAAINRHLLRAILDPIPQKVQHGVRTMLLWLIMLDASIVFFMQADRYWIAVVVLMIPVQVLGRVLAVT